MLGSKSNFHDLMQLTHTVNELDSISGILNLHGIASIHLKDEKFTGKNILDNMVNKELIHLSTHTLIDEYVPMNSTITVQGEEGGEKDTAITLSNFFNKNAFFTNQPLVILSSCKSSGGQPTEEGMVGFGKLFIMRGAANVVGSICEVADAATAAFFSRFYYYLIERHYDAVNALHQTQVDLIATGTPPANWSSFIIHTK
jgi:CHAT domain-containing protein